MRYLQTKYLSAALLVMLCGMRRCAAADDFDKGVPNLKVPAGFSIELVAGPPLVERPIVASFDDEGRLYAAESSGSNDPVAKQLIDLPHRIVRLEDTNGDGKFDKRTVFADKMMFPEGALFFDGSLYVSAPPSIWKLTDTDGDGVADKRVEWFQGKTLTGCANDLHGPYAGPDGWIYWCKGAFAEQTHKVNGREWKTRASHIFRCRPDGSGFEPVMTAGMDNPVDVVFTPEGERILSGTYFVGNPRRDGLAHAIYGGVYGKENPALDGHPRTGELMPGMMLTSPIAACGLERYESDVFGPEYRDNLFLCEFNVRKVSRHVLRPVGSTYTCEDSALVTSDFVDFHPTDIIEDADGSLVIVDTGGWYKICCPTSQLWKPDVLGGIYRVRRDGANAPADPRGKQIDWKGQQLEQLWTLLGDGRPAVRKRAARELAHRRESPEMSKFLSQLPKDSTVSGISGQKSQTAALARTWALTQIANPQSQAILRAFLSHDAELVRHAAASAASLQRDGAAKPQLLQMLASDTPPNRRIAAEALGRIGDKSAVAPLLSAAAHADDRIQQHSVTYALIELADPAATRAGLTSKSPRTVAAALIALDQMPGGGIAASQVVPLLNSDNEELRQSARWLVTRHADWGGDLTHWFRDQLGKLPHEATSDSPSKSAAELESLLVGFAADANVQQLLTETLTSPASAEPRRLALRVIAEAKVKAAPPPWRAALAAVIAGKDQSLLPLAVTAAGALPSPPKSGGTLTRALISIADAPNSPRNLRVASLAIVADGLPAISDAQFQLLLAGLSAEDAVTTRSAAADAISKAKLSDKQLDQLCGAITTAGPLELNRLLTPFKRSTDEPLGLKLLASLKDSAGLASLRLDLLRDALAKYGPAVQQSLAKLELLVNVDAAAQRKRIEELLPTIASGDVRRGHAVFYSAKASCSACHKLGHAGGTTGPELTKVGESRTERDLLESILYPSLSFVRSYEAVLIVTTDGKTINGVVQNETPTEYVLATGPDQQARVLKEDVDQLQPSTVSIMPAGLDKQLTTQELADLVTFLKNPTGK